MRVGLMMVRSHGRGLVVADTGPATAVCRGRSKCRGWLLLLLLLLPALVLAQAYPEQRVALRRAHALKCVKSGGRRRGGRPGRRHSATATLASGQLTAVVLDLQYLQFEESQSSDVLRACKWTKKKIKKNDQLTFSIRLFLTAITSNRQGL